MLKHFRTKMIAPEIIREFDREKKRADDAELSANRRYASLVAGMDPFEQIIKRFNGIFSEEFTRPEENLDARGRLGMTMWAYQQKNDPHFNHMINWIMNSAGNETVKRSPITIERSMYGRAQIANMVLLRDEVGRLSSLYEDELDKRKVQEIDSSVTVEA
jgi:hypothetical protein